MAGISETQWGELLREVRLRDPTAFRSWFHELPTANLENGILQISTTNEAQTSYLTKLRGLFAQATQLVTGRLLAVSFKARPEVSQDRNSVLLQNGASFSDRFTFDDFIVGEANRFAHATLLSIAVNLGRLYNPFYVYGPRESGKTHLLRALCSLVYGTGRTSDDAKPQGAPVALYQTADEFTNNVIASSERGEGLPELFPCEEGHLFVLDELERLEGRARTQEAIFHLVNAAMDARCQLVFASRLPPHELGGFEARLITRFASGLVVPLDAPGYETRVAILRAKATLQGAEVPVDVLSFVAEQAVAGGITLEDALSRITRVGAQQGQPITLELAHDALRSGAKVVKLGDILDAIGRRFSLAASEIMGKNRSKALVRARHLCFYLARRLTTHSLQEIGDFFGGRDHSSVLHATKSMASQSKHETGLALTVRELTRELTSEP